MTKNYPSLIVTPKKEKFLLLDGWHRFCIAKELGWDKVWCEIWEMEEKQQNLLLATLNRLRGVDDTKKRVVLISSLFQEFGEDKDLLLRLLPESEKSLNAELKMAETGLDEAIDDLETEKGIVEQNLSQVVSPDEAQKMARMFKWQGDGKARLTFVFDNEDEYFEALKYFGRIPDVIKLMELIMHNKQDA